ncbi:hypothetical protein HMPREF0972_00965 [Actinomyces sp. oral taxon 848 str. F0332]|nr:hypothetical protein HMPREF0972_00965 [Actinomyces sp. oral taxon 848 str. F0332]
MRLDGAGSLRAVRRRAGLVCEGGRAWYAKAGGLGMRRRAGLVCADRRERG